MGALVLKPTLGTMLRSPRTRLEWFRCADR
jgi:hypothetical protein